MPVAAGVNQALGLSELNMTAMMVDGRLNMHPLLIHLQNLFLCSFRLPPILSTEGMHLW